jgi:hypothetical protein
VGSEPGAAGVGTRHLYQLRQRLENGPPGHVDSQRPENGSHHVECLTCNSSCEYSDIYLSKDNSYYLLHCLGPQVPYLQVRFYICRKIFLLNLCFRNLCLTKRQMCNKGIQQCRCFRSFSILRKAKIEFAVMTFLFILN